MLKEELSGGGNPTWARVCDTCRSSPSRVYCRADATYLCVGCDARLHASASGHERVWICEACERVPAAFVCKADAASLCADCDAKVHSANPLARRHQRFPILPISGCLYGASATNPGRRVSGSVPTVEETDDVFDEDDEEEAASWLLLNPSNNNNMTKEINNNNNNNNGCSLGGEVVDEYLDLVEFDLGGENGKLTDESYNHHGTTQHSHHEHHQYAVPIGVGQRSSMHEQHTYQIGLDFDHIKSDHYAYNNNALSIGHSVSVSSLDVGIVPESSTSDMSTTQTRPSKGTIELFSSTPLQQMPTQLSPMDREARVQRYREKKKTRRFEKTIRYASRKAYAETRPRIKGRFAKRTHIEAEVDQMFPNAVMADTGYGVVPSF